MFFLWIVLACQNGDDQLQAAELLLQEGRFLAATKAFEQVVSEQRGSSSAEVANKRLQTIHFKLAESLAPTAPQKAEKVYRTISEKWPDDPVDLKARSQLNQLRVERQENIERLRKDRSHCALARQRKSRQEWMRYLQEFPAGECSSEANTFIERSLPPREMERAELQGLANKCRQEVQSDCQKFRLTKTTEVATCADPMRSFEAEFARLGRRIKELQEKGELQYIEDMLLPRWGSLHTDIQESCKDSLDYVEVKSSQGVDPNALLEELEKTCSICSLDTAPPPFSSDG